MAEGDFSDQLRQFIAAHINSIEQLEVLLLLRRIAPKEVGIAFVTRELSSHPYSVEGRLLDLLSRRLLTAREVDGEMLYRYDPDPNLVPVLDELALAYTQRRTSVVTLIFSKPIDKIRTFADAFVIKKKPDER
jgi:hypothetical protein